MHGQIFRFVSSLHPKEPNTQGYGQLYYLDFAETTTKRLENQ
jgi:hypothetical protein